MALDTAYYQSQKDRARAQYRSEAALNKQGRIVGNMQANRAIREYRIDNKRQRLENNRAASWGVRDVQIDAKRGINDTRTAFRRGRRDVNRQARRDARNTRLDYNRQIGDFRRETRRQRPEEYAQYGARGLRNSGVRNLGIQRFEGDFERGLSRLQTDRDWNLEQIAQDRRTGVRDLRNDRDQALFRIRGDRKMDIGRLRAERQRANTWARQDLRRYTGTGRNKGYLIQDRMAMHQGYDLNLGSLQQQRDWAIDDINYEKARDKALAALNLSALKPYF